MNARAAKTHVLVGTDGSGCSRAAVEWALETAVLLGGRLTLLRVLEPDGAHHAPTPGAASPPQPRAPEARLPELDDLLQRRGTARVRLGGLVLHGRPDKILAQESATADLLVVGSGRQGGLRQALLGSVCRHVVTHSSCPVVVVPAGWPEAMRSDRATRGPVVVGVDGSEASQRAVLWAAGHARACGAPLALVHAYARSGAPEAPEAPEAPASTASRSSDLGSVEHAESLLRRGRRVAERELAGSPIPLSAEASPGSAGAALASATDRGRLLVLGAHSGRLPSHRLGRVLRACLDRASCPVVVVPAEATVGSPSTPVGATSTRR